MSRYARSNAFDNTPADRTSCTGLIESIEEAYDSNEREFVILIHLRHDRNATLRITLDAYLELYPALQEMKNKSYYLRFDHYTTKYGQRPAADFLIWYSVAEYNTKRVQRKYKLEHDAMLERLADPTDPSKLYDSSSVSFTFENSVSLTLSYTIHALIIA